MENRSFFRVICILLFLLPAGGGVPAFGQARMDRLSLGSNWANPVLDNFLMDHVIYARDTLSIHEDSGTPSAGIVGTNVFTNTTRSSSGARLDLQSGEARIQDNRGNLRRITPTPPATNVVYFGGGGNAITGSTSRNPVYGNNGVMNYPRLPEIPRASWPTNQAEATALGIQHFRSTTTSPWAFRGCDNNLLITGEQTWDAGVYWIDGDLVLNNNARLTIRPVNGSYRTIIYVKGSFFMRVGSSFVPQGFVSIGDYPEAARGQIMVIALSDRCDDCMALQMPDCPVAAVHLAYSVRDVIGTFIAPYGAIYVQWQSRISGQLLAEKIRFVGPIANTGFLFEPFTNLGITANSNTFTKDWTCDRTPKRENITVTISPAPAAGTTVTVRYEFTNFTGTLTAADIVDARTATTPPRTLTFNATTTTQMIPIDIIQNRNMNAGTFRVTLSGAQGGTDVNYTLTNGTITINATGTAQTRTPAPTFGAITQPFEYVGDDGAVTNSRLASRGRGQVIATLTNHNPNFVYTSGNSQFSVNSSGQIVTSSTYDLDFETPANRDVRFTITARDNTRCSNAPDLRTSVASNEIRVQIRPWNDNRFATQPNVSRTINSGSSTAIDTAAWFISDRDSVGANNRALVRGIAVNAGVGGTAGAWNANNSITASSTIPNLSIGGGTVSVSGNTVNVTGVTSDVSFHILARDSAAYGYSPATILDYFDRWIPVNITINQPPAGIDLTRCNNSDTTITIAQLRTAAGLTTGHTLVSAYSALERASLSGTGSSAGLRYNLIPPVTATSDVITYTVRNTNTTPALETVGTINVTINPVRERAPQVLDTIVSSPVFIGLPTTINIVTANDWVNRNALPSEFRVHGEVSNITPAGLGIEVSVINAEAGVFEVLIPRAVEGTPTVTFQYRIIDNRSYAPCDAFNLPNTNISNLATVTITTQRMGSNFVAHDNDTIIVNEGGTATALWNGNLSVMDNDDLVSESGVARSHVEIAVNPTRATAFNLDSNGTFTYTHDDGEAPFTDQFTYWLVNIDGERTPTPATVFIIVNPLNDNAPTFAPNKRGTLQAGGISNFTVIGDGDDDLDWETILKLNRNVPLEVRINNETVLPSIATASIVGDSSLSFRFVDGLITSPTTAVVRFNVNDSVDYTHAFNSDESGIPANADWATRPYREFESYLDSITLTILPNPQAVNFTMEVSELGETRTLRRGTSTFNNIPEAIPALSALPRSRWDLELGDTTHNGNINASDWNLGTVVYRHEDDNPATGFRDSLSYTLTITLDCGTPVVSTGWIRVTVLRREPRVLEDGAFYEDINADGRVDRATIPFDRGVNRMRTLFEVIFNGSPIEHNGGRFAVVDGNEVDSIIVLSLLDAPENTTGGAMTITVIHDPELFPEAQNSTVSVADSAAPVVSMPNASYIRSLIPGISDTLILRMSERATVLVGGGNLPFRFWSTAGDSLYTVSFANSVIGSNNEYTLAVNLSDNGKISAGDYVFVNWEADSVIADDGRISQTNPANQRVPIVSSTRTQILSATYFDTIVPSDGYINRIRFDFGMSLPSAVAQRIAEALVLPTSRGFTKGAVTLTETGFDLAVTEARRATGARTSVATDELISIAEITDGAITVEASSVTPLDSVAPVILRAYYIFSSDSPDTTLEVVFSEPVRLSGTGVPSPYLFLATAQNREYGMLFVPKAPVRGSDNSRWIYEVESTTIPLFPVNGDSIWIVSGGHVFDLVGAVGNEATSTVRAPLILPNQYADGFELFIVPQPLRLVNDKGRTVPDTLHGHFMQQYDIPADMSRGVALVVVATGPVSQSGNSGSIRIIDNIGNVVRENVEMRFVVVKEGIHEGKTVGVAVWDGKNEWDRLVGAASYLALIDVSVVFTDRANPVTRQFRQLISVRSSGTNRGD